jgi:cytochrome c5
LRLAYLSVATVLAAVAATPAQAADGRAIYDKHCAICHNKIPPKIGDKAAWAKRTSKGTQVLVTNTIKGLGKMPPQVGKSGLSNAQVESAVQYLLERSK